MTIAALLAFIGSKSGLSIMSWIWAHIALPYLIDKKNERKVDAKIREIDSATPGARIQLP